MVHLELPSEDVERATAFWNGLFGWGLGRSAMEGSDYRMAQIGPGQGVAVFPSADGSAGTRVYLETDDIDASIGQVRSLGGTAEDKQPVPAYGWFAPCTDTEGNAFSLWQQDAAAA
jgi:uncharacterized protein